MGKRVSVGFVLSVTILVVFFVLPDICLPIMIAALSVVGLHEVLQSTGFVKNKWIIGLSLILGAAIPFWVYYGFKLSIGLYGVFLYFVAIFLVAITSHYTVTIEMVSGAFFFTVLIPYFLSSFVRLSQVPDGLGKFYILAPLLAAFSSDVFALFSGMAFGKHKLAPDLSPKKTKEGAVGGFFGAIGCYLLYGLLMEHGFGFEVNYSAFALYGGLGSIIAQIGDLSFSYIKRQYGLKDFGKVFPGHGGVLDRFDSVIFCAPLMEILIYLLPALKG